MHNTVRIREHDGDRPNVNHNVYILGAGFSADAGLPLVNNFLERMADAVEWLYGNKRDHEAESVRSVFDFRLRAAGAAYRAEVNIDNIEELFSLASAGEGESRADEVISAIAATLDFAELTTKRPTCEVQLKETIPPTWRKIFAEQLVHIWEGAVDALNKATRIIVIGFSMPPTDTHFKYLIAAGLQRNISLRKFLFVNPGLDTQIKRNVQN